MILIFSQNFEETTNTVIDYLSHNSEIKIIRLNTEDLVQPEVKFSLDEEYFNLNGKNIYYRDIKVVWFRRWFDYEEVISPLLEVKKDDEMFYRGLRSFLIEEINTLFNFFVYKLAHCFWLSRPEDNDINKLKVLSEAKKVGLSIPKTVVTNRKKNLSNEKLITKTMGDSSEYKFRENEFTFYTEKIDKNELNDSFYPSLFQTEIEKDFEIRSFFLDGNIFSVAIFSQNNVQTSVDFRHYDIHKPNFNTQYDLPQKVKTKINQLMDKLDLVTGSIDLIYSKSGEYIFLEINPIGQFGSVSDSANFSLEKRVAELLVTKHNQYE